MAGFVVTEAVKQRIRELRAQGATRDAIAAAVGVSAGSVSNVLKEPPPAPPKAASKEKPKRRRQRPAKPSEPPGPPPEPGPPPTLEQLRGDLGAQLRSLQADAERARRKGDDVGLARAQRHAAALATVLARITRDAPLEQGMLQVSLESVQDAAQRMRAKLHELVDKALEQAADER